MKIKKFFNVYIGHSITIGHKEKIIILVKGNIEVKSNNKTYSLNEFDAVNFYADNTSYTIKSNSNSQIFIISADKLKPQKKQVKNSLEKIKMSLFLIS